MGVLLLICHTLPILLLQASPRDQLASHFELANRDMSRYTKAGPFEWSAFSRPDRSIKEFESDMRGFVWNKWRQQQRAYTSLVIVNKHGERRTVSFFVEPDRIDRWVVFMIREEYEIGRGGLGYQRYEAEKFFGYQLLRIEPPEGTSDRVEIKAKELEPKPDTYRLLMKDQQGLELTVF